MFGKIKQYKNKTTQWLDGFRDARILGLLLFLIILLMVSWSSVNVIGTNYQLQQQINQHEQQNKVAQLANDNIDLQNQYFETPQYLDIVAREHFGLANEGETVLVVPESVALRFTIDPPASSPVLEAGIEAKKAQPAYQQNFQAWMDFLLHRK